MLAVTSLLTLADFMMIKNVGLIAVLLVAGVVGCDNAAKNAGTNSASTSTRTPTVIPSGAAHEVEVIGLDYAFSMPDTVDAGRTAFKFTNKGKVRHEYNVVLLKEGVSLTQYIDAANKDLPRAPLRDGPLGVLFALPGHTSASVLSAEMLPGRTYAVQCIFKDSATAPTHREMGMYKAFTVRPSITGASEGTALAFDTIVGTDYAYTKYPRTLAPGWHHFVFANTGKQRHEISIALLKTGVTLKQVLDTAGKDGDVDSLLDESLGVLHAEAGTHPLASLDFDVLAGREYILICTFTDTPRSPPHFALGMVTSMVASR